MNGKLKRHPVQVQTTLLKVLALDSVPLTNRRRQHGAPDVSMAGIRKREQPSPHSHSALSLARFCLFLVSLLECIFTSGFVANYHCVPHKGKLLESVLFGKKIHEYHFLYVFNIRQQNSKMPSKTNLGMYLVP